ncbi:hypothetical protein [Microbacterium forte]|uniref:hypothetical protein n=1 Tax=Microbacterium forte TaxID=2982533 RepID=UPI002892B9F7|nr:hypothetical protein [Microbacterium sp. A(2022)]
MIIAPVRARAAFADGRLDAKYHCSPGVLANDHMRALQLAGAEIRRVAGIGGLGSVGATSRTRRVYAAPGEDSLPYLRPYDIFDYMPQAADQLSKSGSTNLQELVPEVGTILQTCSGRNLGPLAYADAYISRFVVSDDMLRLQIADKTSRLYTLAFLSTPTGQALLTRSKTGNVIDHLSADDLSAVQVPFIDPLLTNETAEAMQEAIRTRERARLRLEELVREFASELPQISSTDPLKAGWPLRASSLGGRLDAAFHDPRIDRVRDDLKRAGGTHLGAVADTSMPNRYKRYYVDESHGRPIMSGRQLLQLKPVNLQYIAARALDFKAYELGAGTLVFGARGRAEERISLPALITEDRSSWLASHNVMRVRPKEGISPGWLYLCFATEQVQLQVKGSAFGSVVDVVDPANLNEIILPPVDEERGNEADRCWANFAAANALEAETVARLEQAILMKAVAA